MKRILAPEHQVPRIFDARGNSLARQTLGVITCGCQPSSDSDHTRFRDRTRDHRRPHCLGAIESSRNAANAASVRPLDRPPIGRGHSGRGRSAINPPSALQQPTPPSADVRAALPLAAWHPRLQPRRSPRLHRPLRFSVARSRRLLSAVPRPCCLIPFWRSPYFAESVGAAGPIPCRPSPSAGSRAPRPGESLSPPIDAVTSAAGGKPAVSRASRNSLSW